MTLDEFTRSVDAKSLPRVLQMQSGYYFQGKTEDIILAPTLLTGLAFWNNKLCRVKLRLTAHSV